jgi:hypothetical protein
MSNNHTMAILYEHDNELLFSITTDIFLTGMISEEVLRFPRKTSFYFIIND